MKYGICSLVIILKIWTCAVKNQPESCQPRQLTISVLLHFCMLRSLPVTQLQLLVSPNIHISILPYY